VGTALKLTGTGNATLFLQQSSSTSVSATICIGLYVVPGGVLTGVLTPIGVPFTETVTLPSGAATPVTVDYDLGLGAPGYSASGILGTDVELVATVASSATPVTIASNPAAGVNDQGTIDTSS
jgi:hypothetical protein